MSKKAYLKVYRCVGMEGSPSIVVSPSPDDPKRVRLTNSDEESRKWFGGLNMSMDTQMARKLAEALIACADEIEGMLP